MNCMRKLGRRFKEKVFVSRPSELEDTEPEIENDMLPIFMVLRVEPCARAILDHVPARELVRSERVCRRWQELLHEYLGSCRSLWFCDVPNMYWVSKDNLIGTNTYRVDRRQISLKNSTLPLACKTVAKLGSCMVKVVTQCNSEDFLEIIASKCNNLRHISIILKHYAVRNTQPSEYADNFFSEHLLNVNYDKLEHLEIANCCNLAGSFLKSIKAKSLKSLNLSHCEDLQVAKLLSADHILRNITSLTLDFIDLSFKTEGLNLLLQAMPQLQKLSLQGCCRWTRQCDEESILAFSRLENLKSLDISRNEYFVNDALLGALAQGSKKLEYLDLRRCKLLSTKYDNGTVLTARGLGALCRRSPSAVTSLHFGYVDSEIVSKDQVVNGLIKKCKALLLDSECRVEVTRPWLEAACRAARGRKVPIELPSGYNTALEDPRQKLKILLCDDILWYDLSTWHSVLYGLCFDHLCFVA